MGIDKDAELADLLEQIAKHLRERSEPMPPDFSRVVDDKFWDLLARPPTRPMCEACKRGGVCGCYQPLYDSPIC